jgi:GNAT superfamily N-acetyltransferase
MTKHRHGFDSPEVRHSMQGSESVKIEISVVSLGEILTLRDLYRQEMNCQIVHDSLHQRGFTEMYLIRLGGQIAGYGCVAGFGSSPRHVIKEYYVLPAFRAAALPLFRRLIDESRARKIEAQTNDVLLTLMLFDCAVDIESETILFHDVFTTSHAVPGICFRRVAESDRSRIFPHTREPVGDWLIEVEGQVAATGGIYFHYNIPYGDLFMEVAEPFRRRGYGRYLVQELKRTCYQMGRIPAARCNESNVASRSTLQSAGLLPCARIVSGMIPDPLASESSGMP